METVPLTVPVTAPVTVPLLVSTTENCVTNCSSDLIMTPPPVPVVLPPWFMITVMTILSILAVVGNILAIFCFLRFRKKMKQNTIAYLVSLAVSDLWIGFMLGCGVLSVVYERWVLGDFLCQTIGFLNNVALINSLWTVALGSVDRCFAIRVPFRHRTIITKRRLAMLITGTWSYACLMSFPPLLGVNNLKYMFHPSHPWCAMSSRFNVAYFLAFNIGFLPLPIIIILTSYVVIFITTRKYTRRQLDRISGSSPSWRPLSCESTLEMKRQTSESTQPHKHLAPNFTFPCTNEPIVRLSDEVPLNISSSYDTLRVRQGKWVPQTPNMNSAEETEKSFYKQIVQALRALLIWRPNQGEGEQQPHSFVYRTRNTSIALSEEEAAARKLRNQAGTLLIVIGTTILVSYTPLLSIAFLAAFHYNVNVTYSEVQGFILLMLSNASINPLIYFLLNKEFRVAAKSIFFDSAIAIRLRRQSSSFSTRGSVFSQTLTTDASAHHSVTVPVRPASLSASNDFIYRHSHKTPSQESDVTTTPSPVKLKPRIGEYYRPSSDPVIKRHMTATLGKGRTRPVSGKLAAEERIQKHVLRNSLIVLAPSDREAIKSKSSGLINLSFYEVESAL